MHPHAHYEHLARLFDYPGRDYPRWVQSTHELLCGRYVIAAAHIEALAMALPTDGGPLGQEALDEVQEIFSRSFDIQPITTLAVGYVMFGDDYKRGELLVNLQREQKKLNIDLCGELPDHLPNVLRLLARWEDRDLAEEFVVEILYPALHMMIDEFSIHRTAARNELYREHHKTLLVTSPELGTIFREPLEAIRQVLSVDYDLGAYEPAQRDNEFLRGIEREMQIEGDEGRPMTSECMQ